jgi:hypothetical protein
MNCNTCKYYKPYSPPEETWRKPIGVCNLQLPPWVAGQLYAEEEHDRVVGSEDMCHFHKDRTVEV